MGYINILYMGQFLSDILIIVLFYFHYTKKMNQLPNPLLDFVYISGDFTPEKENCLAFTIRTNKDAVNASVEVIDFCKSKGISDQKSYYCGLCLEEMTVDTINRVFPKSKNKSCIRCK